ncbi:uncharacterized protein LOC132198192 [Neocloeon triangulifer]|uniref:uncharacterized protein LOC132198192 n=1 Tax=Neocloeon triangulifer TaxID=2078957 RepID=UPI00286FAC9D|nr:uncharacterized protein LOC132198192 [Neocloeon triangulifer]
MLRFGAHRCAGLRALHGAGLVLGFWIPSQAGPAPSLLLHRVFSALLTVAFVGQSLFSLYMTVCFTVDGYVTGVLYAVSLITVLKHLFSIVYFQIRRNRLVQIFAELQVVMDKYNYPFVDLQRMARRVSFRSFVIYFLLPSAYIVLMRSNTISLVEIVRNPAENNATEIFSLNQSLGTFRRDFHRFFNHHSENLFRVAIFVSTMSNLREIAANAFLMTAYLIIAEQMEILTECLRRILWPPHFLKVDRIFGQKFGKSAVNLEVWQEFQQKTARVLDEINRFSSPITVISIGSYVALLTLSAFALTKMFSEPEFATNFMTGCILYLTEIYLYCEVGHRIKKQADAMGDVIFHGPWLRLEAHVVPVVHFLSLDCQRSFSAVGGPFFTLSLEFFATVVGAFFTYFIVAVQIK